MHTSQCILLLHIAPSLPKAPSNIKSTADPVCAQCGLDRVPVCSFVGSQPESSVWNLWGIWFSFALMENCSTFDCLLWCLFLWGTKLNSRIFIWDSIMLIIEVPSVHTLHPLFHFFTLPPFNMYPPPPPNPPSFYSPQKPGWRRAHLKSSISLPAPNLNHTGGCRLAEAAVRWHGI